MRHRRAGVVLAGFTLALCVVVGGCQSTSPFGAVLARHDKAAANLKPAAAPFVLVPGMEVEWHVKTARNTPNQINSGRSIVAPDGTVELGPYGSCRVAGLPMAQASAALERHLARYLQHPSVSVTPRSASAAPEQIAWRKSSSTPSSAMGRNDGAIFPVSFQTPGPMSDPSNLEIIPPPKLMVSSTPATAPPLVVGAPFFAPSAPSECKPELLPPYVIGPTDVLLVDSLIGLQTQPVRGPHLVGPDGSVRLGVYGSAIVAGLTLDQAKAAVAQAIYPRLRQVEKEQEGKKEDEKDLRFKGFSFDDVLKGVSVDVLAYNSKQFFIISDGGGQGDQVVTLPITGNDTVLNAMSKIGGLGLIASKQHIWVSRLTCPGCPESRLDVDWLGITQRGEGATNWLLRPGDRIYVKADNFYAADRHLGKWLAPAERLLGAILLGSQATNSLKSGSVSGVR